MKQYTPEENSALEAEFNQLLADQRQNSENDQRCRNAIASIDETTTKLVAISAPYSELKK